MFARAFTALLVAAHIAVALGGQIPVVNGVIGGVTKTMDSNAKVKLSTLTGVSPDASSKPTPGKLRVTENSGVCETTSGVYQASGYGDLSSDESIWFWFFAARNNPETAPLALWFNGGPGSSSMIGLFQEHGPCRITNDSSSVTLNPYSWNNNANVLYIDQPVGVGFSYGSLNVGTSQEAANDVWKFLQIFFSDSRFSSYAAHPLGIWAESYGGHYAPTFAAYFLSQNAGIANGSVTGTKINLQFLGIGDGLTDPLVQYPGYVAYAGGNRYHQLVSTSTINSANKSLTRSGGCLSQITSCYNDGSDSVCSNAQDYCNNNILSPLAGNYDVYYVPTVNPDPYPPDITDYLSSIATKVGAQSTWQETNDNVYENFAETGDWMRNSRPNLETVIKAGVRTLIFDGDADYILNYFGVEAMVNALQTQWTSLYQQQQFSSFMVNGHLAGQYKNAGTFSYVRIYGAGHEVPAYQYTNLAVGQAASQFFNQIMSNQSLSST